jgi:cell shape-determining protein MreC
MANETPRFNSRLPYIIACLFGLALFFLDTTYKTFDPLDRIKISSKNFLQSGLNDLKNSFVSVQINFSEKKLLIDENKSLKEELSILSVVAQQDTFNSRHEDASPPHRIINFDTDQYFCCSNHRMFVEKNEKSYPKGFALNSTGLIGQIIKGHPNSFELILLSDIDHKIPIYSKDFEVYCNAEGTGFERLIVCKSSKDIDKELIIGQEFYTSGFGGIFNKDMPVGKAISFIQAEDNEYQISIEMFANPLTDEKVFLFKSS